MCRPPKRAARLVDTRSFDAIRGWAAVQVAFGHYYAVVYGAKGRLNGQLFGGSYCVLLFFIMSGFVMTVAYADQHCARSFWWRRISRILPIYWLSIALDVAQLLAEHATCPNPRIGELWHLVPLRLVFLQQWLPWPIDFGPNLPLWTLSVQAYFWAAFPSLVGAVHQPRTARRTFWLCALLWALYMALTAVALLLLWSLAQWQLLATSRGQIHLYLSVHMAPYTKFPLCMLGMLLGSHAVGRAAEPPSTPAVPPPRLSWAAVADLCTLAYLGHVAAMLLCDDLDWLGVDELWIWARAPSELYMVPLFAARRPVEQ